MVLYFIRSCSGTSKVIRGLENVSTHVAYVHVPTVPLNNMIMHFVAIVVKTGCIITVVACLVSTHMYDRLEGSTCTWICPSCYHRSHHHFGLTSSVVRCQDRFLVSRSRPWLGHQVSRLRPRAGSSGLETKTKTLAITPRDLQKMNSSLETMVSRSQHWLHQFQLEPEHSLKGATNYGNRATDVGTKHAVFRPRPRP